jgi:Apea-like HEPN
MSRSSPSFLERLNRILNLVARGTTPAAQNVDSRTFGLGSDDAITVTGENIQFFDSVVNDLLNSIPGVSSTLSTKKFLGQLIPKIRDKKISNSSFNQSESDSFQQQLLDIPAQSFRVLRPIHGIALPEDGDPIKIGDFTVYASRHLREMARASPNLFVIWRSRNSEEAFIECVVEARDTDRAVDLADVLFYRLELMIRFFIGRRTTRFEIGILNYIGPQLRDQIVLSEGGRAMSEGGAWQGALSKIPLGDPFFCKPSPPFARLLRLISQKNNQLEMHVVRCAEWTAQAMGDPNPASAFVKAAIALEVLFSATEKGVITPSIMAQIAESCAFLLANAVTEALEVESKVKRLYSIRSAVVHSGKDSVAEADLDAFIQICRRVIIVLLSEEEFAEIDTMAKLADYFKRHKYGVLRVGNT